jgi:hypothetical protein
MITESEITYAKRLQNMVVSVMNGAGSAEPTRWAPPLSTAR